MTKLPNMKKEICEWCGEKKVPMINANFVWGLEVGVKDATSPSKILLVPREISEKKYGSKEQGSNNCYDCWVSYYKKIHPNHTVEVLETNA